MAWLIAVALGVLLWLRLSPFAVGFVALLLLYVVFDNGHAEYLAYDLWEALNRDSVSVLPVFALASVLMSRGVGMTRLCELLQILTLPWAPALALACLLSVTFTSAMTASPAVALLAIGPLLYRSLLQSGHTNHFSIGLLCMGSVIGALLPLSPMLVMYSVIGEQSLGVLLGTASVWAGGLLALTCIYALLVNWDRYVTQRGSFESGATPINSHRLHSLLVGGLPTAASVVVLFVALASGQLTVAQCGLLFLFSTAFVEWVFCRRLSIADSGRAVLDTFNQLGRVLPLLALSVSFSVFLLYQNVPEQLGAWLTLYDVSAGQFLLLTNLALLALGALADPVSAVLLVAPMLAPAAEQMPIQGDSFGAMLVLNLAAGYLTPPNGLVLVAAMFAFREQLGTVLAAVAPFFAVLWLGVLGIALSAIV